MTSPDQLTGQDSDRRTVDDRGWQAAEEHPPAAAEDALAADQDELAAAEDAQAADQDAQRLAERCAEAMLAADTASAWLGIRLVSVGPGRAELAMTVTEQMLNGHRIGHGGFVFSLADSAFAVACNSYNRSTVAAGCDIDFTAPVRGGDELTAVAVERYRSGRSGLYDVSVRRADGTVVAEMRGRAREVPGSLV